MRLYTFLISHFSEKVRWALDYEGIDYVEVPLLPGAHIPTIRRRAPKTTVPLLKDGDRHIQGSSAILDHLHGSGRLAKLAPEPPSAEELDLERRADHVFGLGTQRIFYHSLLKRPSAVVDLWTQGAPWWGRAFYAATMPFVAKAVRRQYRTEPEAVEKAKDRWRKLVAELDARLGGRRYLSGDAGPKRIDVAVAALLAPACRPPEHPLRWPPLDPDADPSFTSFLRDLEDRPTWHWVLRMYRDHRRPRAVDG